MKTVLILLAGILLGVLATVLGGWLYMNHASLGAPRSEAGYFDTLPDNNRTVLMPA